ncbi:hypothetical protein BFJ65_g15112 [Fusarium oxysporum f. sp. cepae]|uniref:Uncharacterized protein n=1 Tax=Fusarium oxysporum f. sp. cepae TaxID=396571 RepID=A0A3L6N1A3_FUSOX|nr:hypothetical protein BFJ65_g15112 [Fusarium oxysporum f. sp. cepae]
MLERFLYSLPPRGTSLLVARPTVVVGEGKGEGATTLNVKQQDAAIVVWASEAAEVGRTGENRGGRARNVTGSRSQNVEVERRRR